MPESSMAIVSSRATDILMRPDGSVITELPGGPLIFIESALLDAGIPFTLHEGEKMRVEIEVHDDGEYGRIAPPASVRKLGELGLGKWCVISTLLDEWYIDDKLPQCLLVDIQGYVRDGSAFGRKQKWPIESEISREIFCLKGTDEEVGYLPEDLIEDQKLSRMLVVTHGKDGATIYSKGEEVRIPAEVVKGLPNTVGAGDTFFAYFAASLYQGNDFRVAGMYASKKTAAFLSKKVQA